MSANIKPTSYPEGKTSLHYLRMLINRFHPSPHLRDFFRSEIVAPITLITTNIALPIMLSMAWRAARVIQTVKYTNEVTADHVNKGFDKAKVARRSISL